MSGTRHLHVTSADGTKIAVTARGGGRPLVITHGALATAQQWQPLAEHLAPHLTVYAFDRRGRGGSGDHAAHSLEREQQDLAAVLELAGPDAIVLGHSYGGTIALAHALQHPPAGLVLYEPGLALSGAVGGKSVVEHERLVAEGDLDGAFEHGLRHFLQLSEEDVEAFRADPNWIPRAALTPTWARELRAIDGFGGDLDRFAAVSCPALLLCGGLSPSWLVDALQRLQRALPDSRLADLPGHAHDGYLTAPGEVAQRVLDFTSTCPSTSQAHITDPRP